MRRRHINLAVRTALPMLVVVGQNSIGKRDQRLASEVFVLRVVVLVQHLRDDFQCALNVIAHIAALNLIARIIPAKVVEIRQAPEILGLHKRGSSMMVIRLRAVRRHGQSVDIHIKPGLKKIVVARCNKRPVEKAIVLVPVAAAPLAIIRVVVLWS